MSKRINYSSFDEKLLTELVDSNKKVVESKITNSRAIEQKNNAWKKLAEEYNATAFISSKRTVDQLRKKWFLLKSNSYKEVNKEKRERRKTGGGPEDTSASNASHRIVSLLSSQATPLENQFDCDHEYFQSHAQHNDRAELNAEQVGFKEDALNDETTVMDVTHLYPPPSTIDNGCNNSALDVSTAGNSNFQENVRLLENSTNRGNNQTSLTAENPNGKRKPTLQQRAITFAELEHELNMKILKAKLERESEKSKEHEKSMELLEIQIQYWKDKSSGQLQ